MATAKLVLLKDEQDCDFCKLKENNKLKYGPLYKINKLVAHYYCVLLSTKMKQNGKDNEGILGFLFNDIQSELKRTKNISCCYCREKNATVQCGHHNCKKVFHYPCGLKEGALSRFKNDFVTFCSVHRPRQKVPKKILNEAVNTELICSICYETVDPRDRINNLWAPCCKRSWYHKDCIQSLAQSSGYFFKCATCNDTAKFKSHMEDNGIFVPLQDASWELEPNAYEELLVRHNRCDAAVCKAPNGREENTEDTRWEIILCRFCGSQGMHVGCGNLKFSDPQWECATCQTIMKTDSSKSTKMDDDAKDDVNVKKSTSKNDQPGTAPRKRKLSEPPEVEDQSKKERFDKEDSDSDDSDDEPILPRPPNRNSGDEFYIRIPEFVMASRRNDKPHTATRPTETNEDQDVDVISMNSAWLMVEEVLSRVKPAPLCHKLKFLRKRCFAFHFDPFDVREETEVIDLVSDSESEQSEPEDSDSDDLDNDEFESEDSNDPDDHDNLDNQAEEDSEYDQEDQDEEEQDDQYESDDPDDCDEPEDSSDIEIIEEMSGDNNKEFEQESEQMDSEPTEQYYQEQVPQQLPQQTPGQPIDVIDITSDDECEMSDDFHEQQMNKTEYPPGPPPTITFGRVYGNLIQVNPDVDMSGFQPNVGFQYRNYPSHTAQRQEEEDEESDSEDDYVEPCARQPGKKHPGRRMKGHYNIKKPRMATTAQGTVITPVPTTSTNWQGLSGFSPFAPGCSTSQTYGESSNVMRGVSLSGFNVVPGTSANVITPGYIRNAQLHPHSAPNRKGQPFSSTSVITAAIPSKPSTLGMTISQPSSTMTTSVITTARSTTSGNEIRDPSISRVATPLPSFQHLLTSRAHLSPQFSSISSGSPGTILIRRPRRIFTALDSSSSSDCSNSGSDGQDAEISSTCTEEKDNP